jgi:hypothetical protein
MNQTRPHYVNQMGKTHSKPLAARHGRGTAWQWNGMGAACYVWIRLNAVVSTTVARGVWPTAGVWDTWTVPVSGHSRFRGRRSVRLMLQRRPYRSKNKIKTIIKISNCEILVCNITLLFWNRAVVLGCVCEYFITVGTTVHATCFGPIHNVNASRSLGQYEIWYDMIWYIQLQLGSHPVAVVQYTYTHKQYREWHKTNDT